MSALVARLFVVAVSALCAAGQSGAAAAGDLSVVEAVWTTNVDNRQYGPRVAPNARARPLYFWTKLRGGAEALATLRRDGKLPIRHHWQYSNVFKSGIEDQEKVLSAGEIQDQGGLSAAGDAFTWRTWTHKQSVWGGTWEVTVLYATGEPVLCDGSPCSWSIKLRE